MHTRELPQQVCASFQFFPRYPVNHWQWQDPGLNFDLTHRATLLFFQENSALSVTRHRTFTVYSWYKLCKNHVKQGTITENTLITKSIFTPTVKFITVSWGEKKSCKCSAASTDYCIFDDAHHITTVVSILLQSNCMKPYFWKMATFLFLFISPMVYWKL